MCLFKAMSEFSGQTGTQGLSFTRNSAFSPVPTFEAPTGPHPGGGGGGGFGTKMTMVQTTTPNRTDKRDLMSHDR